MYPLLLLGAAYLLLMAGGDKKKSDSKGGKGLWKERFLEGDFEMFSSFGKEIPSLTPKSVPKLFSKLARIDANQVKMGWTNLTPAQGLPEGKAGVWNLVPGLPASGAAVKVPMKASVLTSVCVFCDQLYSKTGQDPLIFFRGVQTTDAEWPVEVFVLTRPPTKLDFEAGLLQNTPTGFNVVYAGDWINLRKSGLLSDEVCKGNA